MRWVILGFVTFFAALHVLGFVWMWVRWSHARRQREEASADPSLPGGLAAAGGVLLWAIWQDAAPLYAPPFVLAALVTAGFLVALVAYFRRAVWAYFPAVWTIGMAAVLLGNSMSTARRASEVVEYSVRDVWMFPLPPPFTYWADLNDFPEWTTLRGTEYERLQLNGGVLRIRVKTGQLGIRFASARL